MVTDESRNAIFGFCEEKKLGFDLSLRWTENRDFFLFLSSLFLWLSGNEDNGKHVICFLCCALLFYPRGRKNKIAVSISHRTHAKQEQKKKIVFFYYYLETDLRIETKTIPLFIYLLENLPICY